MPYIVNQTHIFLPMLALVALTLVAFVHLAMARTAAVKGGQDPTFYRAHHGTPEPEKAAAGARHWDNLFELPTLFYAACIVAFVMGGVGRWTIYFAWAYSAARIVQSLVHMTYNDPGHRGGAFMLGVVFLFALWANVAMTVLAHL
jgi:hypothetical protein